MGWQLGAWGTMTNRGGAVRRRAVVIHACALELGASHSLMACSNPASSAAAGPTPERHKSWQSSLTSRGEEVPGRWHSYAWPAEQPNLGCFSSAYALRSEIVICATKKAVWVHWGRRERESTKADVKELAQSTFMAAQIDSTRGQYSVAEHVQRELNAIATPLPRRPMAPTSRAASTSMVASPTSSSSTAAPRRPPLRRPGAPGTSSPTRSTVRSRMLEMGWIVPRRSCCQVLSWPGEVSVSGD
jgi:hypothetical protein